MAEIASPTWSIVERAARDSYGRLVAALAYRFRDIAAAEDALGDALREALERWPTTGVPRSPDAWLMAVAKNRLRQGLRHRAVAEDPRATAVVEQMLVRLDATDAVSGDGRLNLMFVCAHPAIDASVRTPLMLQTVLGLDADRIGDAFLVPGTTMGQRLVRAKQKIRDAGVPFDPPSGRELNERLGAVLEGIYAAFGAGWDDATAERDPRPAAPPSRESLDEEALFLAALLAALVPDEPEVLGLFALMRFSHARRAARFDAEGAFVPLSKQDVSRWDRDAILEADTLLLRAASMRRPGPFQLEAAIQSAHCQRLFSNQTPWTSIATLYEALNRLSPTIGSRVAHAAALAELGRLDDASAQLTSIAAPLVTTYAPYWVVAGHIAFLRGDADEGVVALRRAIELTSDRALREHLTRRLAFHAAENASSVHERPPR